jgi:hypothetical protein
MFNVYDCGCVGIIESNRSPLTRYHLNDGGVKPAPQNLIAYSHNVVPHRIIAVNTMAKIKPIKWSDMV